MGEAKKAKKVAREDLPVPLLGAGLERRYQECLTLEPSFDLLVALHDYIQYINGNPVFDYLFTEKIQKDARELLDQATKTGIKAVKELAVIYEVLTGLVKKHEIDEHRILYPLKECADYVSGKSTSSEGKIEAIYRELVYALQGFSHPKYRALISGYIVPPSPSNPNESFNLGQSYQIYTALKSQFEKQGKVSAWGAFDVVYVCYQAVKAFAYSGPDDKKSKSSWGTSFLASAVETLLNEELGFPKQPDHSVKGFLFKGYSKAVLGRLHFAFLDELAIYEHAAHQKLPEKIRERLNTAAIVEGWRGRGGRPEVFIKNGRGYFRFKSKGNSIGVGGAESQPYRLLALLVEEVEAYKTVDHVFEKIWGDKYQNLDEADSHDFKVQKIIEVSKEWQRIEQFKRGNLYLDFSQVNRKAVRLGLGDEWKILRDDGHD